MINTNAALFLLFVVSFLSHFRHSWRQGNYYFQQKTSETLWEKEKDAIDKDFSGEEEEIW